MDVLSGNGVLVNMYGTTVGLESKQGVHIGLMGPFSFLQLGLCSKTWVSTSYQHLFFNQLTKISCLSSVKEKKFILEEFYCPEESIILELD